MSLQSEAEENLRVIRSLMEKATIYRAISAPGALIGGTASIALSAFMLVGSSDREAVSFSAAWLGLLFFTAIANLWLLRRDAGRRGDPFISPGMRLALRAMLPSLLGGGVCTFVAGDGDCVLTASLWVLFYGASLLAASHFAPRSICWLGRAFFTVGVGLILITQFLFDCWPSANQTQLGYGIMGATFGAFHLAYAACTWPRRSAVSASAS